MAVMGTSRIGRFEHDDIAAARGSRRAVAASAAMCGTIAGSTQSMQKD